jgi:1,4-alpha-glucan branching enzyme
LAFRVGVPVNARYKELINSDDARYGGSGITNPGALNAEEYLCDGRPYSVHIKLPPMGTVILKGRGE